MTRPFARAAALTVLLGGSLMLQGCLVGAVVGTAGAIVGGTAKATGAVIGAGVAAATTPDGETRAKNDRQAGQAGRFRGCCEQRRAAGRDC